jgi:hypothetical protein
MIYKKIIINNDDNEDLFRQQRLIQIIDELYELTGSDVSALIEQLQDNKGTLNVYWSSNVSTFLKNVVGSIWEEYFENNINHIISSYNYKEKY